MLNCIKGLRVTKIVKKIKFEGTWEILDVRLSSKYTPKDICKTD